MHASGIRSREPARAPRRVNAKRSQFDGSSSGRSAHPKPSSAQSLRSFAVPRHALHAPPEAVVRCSAITSIVRSAAPCAPPGAVGPCGAITSIVRSTAPRATRSARSRRPVRRRRSLTSSADEHDGSDRRSTPSSTRRRRSPAKAKRSLAHTEQCNYLDRSQYLATRSSDTRLACRCAYGINAC